MVLIEPKIPPAPISNGRLLDTCFHLYFQQNIYRGGFPCSTPGSLADRAETRSKTGKPVEKPEFLSAGNRSGWLSNFFYLRVAQDGSKWLSTLEFMMAF